MMMMMTTMMMMMMVEVVVVVVVVMIMMYTNCLMCETCLPCYFSASDINVTLFKIAFPVVP